MTRRKSPKQEITTIFDPLLARIARQMEQLGRMRIIPVADFPATVPTINDAGRDAFFAIMGTPAQMTEFFSRYGRRISSLRSRPINVHRRRAAEEPRA